MVWHRQRLKMSLGQRRKTIKKSFFRQKPQKKWRNLHNYLVIIIYLHYEYHLIENIFGTVSFLAFLTIVCCSLFWVTSDSMRWIFSTGIWCREKHLFPNIRYFFQWRTKNFSLAIFRELARQKMLARHSKKYEIFGNKGFSRHQIPVEKILLI